MLFNSFEFLFFLPVALTLFFITPNVIKWVTLLILSYYFYMSWKPELIVLIILSTVIDYFAALLMSKASQFNKKLLLSASLASNLGLLFVFKYYNFFADVLASTNLDIPHLNLILPVGISFYTFQTLSYTIDVYRGKIDPEKNFGKFALYVSYFPQLVAGPIERSTNLLPQFSKKISFDYDRFADGFKLMTWGLFKKTVIADRLAPVVDIVYSTPSEYSGLSLLFATYLFAFQIYCDFSGYSDIAVGVSKMMGINLMDNFKRPYFSKSIHEFWQRWHISLSTWFRDYLYIPLGGNKVSKARWYFNLWIVFVVSGFWHGANWTFIIWGTLHGTYLIISILTAKFRKHLEVKSGITKNRFLYRSYKIFITFHLVVFAWIFFRADNTGEAIDVIRGILFNFSEGKDIFQYLTASSVFLCILSIIILETVHMFQRHENMREMFNSKPAYVRIPVISSMILGIVFFGIFSSNQFIYFQF